MTDFPVLRVRADNAVIVTELSINGIDLIPLHVTNLTLEMDGGHKPHRATLTFAVIPDIELPAAVMRLMVTPPGVEVNDEGVPVTMLAPGEIPLDDGETV